MANILVVDDEMGIRELLSEILGDEGHTVTVAENAAAARAKRQADAVDLVLLDIWMPDTDGITLLKEWAAIGALTMPVIMMCGHATIDTAVEATRIGAIDFLEKPITLQKLLRAVQQGLDRGRCARSARAPRARVRPTVGTAIGRQRRRGDNGVRAGLSFGAMPAGRSTARRWARASRSAVRARPRSVRLAGPFPIRGNVPLDLPLREARDAFERAYFEYHLAQENGSMTRVAEKTGLERTHLYRKLKQLGVELSKAPRR